jgi:hypothetical protein
LQIFSLRNATYDLDSGLKHQNLHVLTLNFSRMCAPPSGENGMPSLNRLFALLVLSSLASLLACGGGGSHINPMPPPTGGFGLSSLKGTYVFSTTGTDATGNNTLLAIVGTFAANGSGGITGGTVDLNDPTFGGTPVKGLAITGGKYSLTSDGRGQATLSATTPFGNSIALDFVLTSNSHGAVTEFDANGSGSGTLDLQSPVTQAQLAGSYAFNLSGVDTGGLSIATVGSFTLGSSGAITAGVQDFNDAGSFTNSNLALSGAVTPGAPGTATLATNGAFGVLSFDVYPIDNTHLKFIEISGGLFLAGDAFSQQGAALPATSTTFAFTLAGQGSAGPVGVGGFMPINGGTISSGLVDVNDAGTVAGPLTFSGSYAASGTVGGRTLFNVSGFSVAAQFVAYPTTSAGLQMLESDGAGLLGGVALAQSTPTPSLQASQGYAMGLSAVNSSSEEDDIAEFSTTSSSFSGIIDLNDQGTTSFDQPFKGNYTLDSPVTGRGELTTTSTSGVNGVFYAVDSSTVLFLETDSNQVGTGIFELQNSGAQGALASQHAQVVPRPMPHGNRKQESK